MTTPKRQQGSWKNKVVCSEFLEERARCNFDQKEMLDILIHPETQAYCQKIADMVDGDADLAPTHKHHEWTKEEFQKYWFKVLNNLYFKKDPEFFFSTKHYNIEYQWWYYFHGASPITVHTTMVLHSIATFGTPDQVKKWLTKAEHMDIMTCYAQTELGHGSDVSGLLTTATYDMKTDEFVIDTPCIEATKWWPGDMGRMSNVALVFAKLLIPDGSGTENSYGIAPFIVEIRDRKTHKHMPGIKSGDMGGANNKWGFNSKDNGWMTFDHVRVPRDQMLSRFMSVDREGTVSIDGDLRILYSTMLRTRVELAMTTKMLIMVSALIAIRYSVARRQFKNISGTKLETQLIDYQTQQMKLFPVMATFYAVSFGCEFLKNEYNLLTKEVEKDDFHRLPLLHHFSSGMKSVYTQDTTDLTLLCRQSIGGAGYTRWSGIFNVFDAGNSMVTLEGDNTVMAQQSFNLMFKLGKQALNGKKDFDSVFTYLNEFNTFQNLRCKASEPKDFLSMEQIFECLKVKVLHQVKKIILKKQESGMKKKMFINHACANEIVKASIDHIRLITYFEFMTQVKTRAIKCQGVRANLANVCMLYGLDILVKDSSQLYDCGYFSTPGVPFSQTLLEAMKLLLKEVRPQIMNLMEIAPLTDDKLQSAVGNSFGDIYETHVEWAMDSRHNHTKHGDAILDGEYEYMQPIRNHKM